MCDTRSHHIGMYCMNRRDLVERMHGDVGRDNLSWLHGCGHRTGVGWFGHGLVRPVLCYAIDIIGTEFYDCRLWAVFYGLSSQPLWRCYTHIRGLCSL